MKKDNNKKFFNKKLMLVSIVVLSTAAVASTAVTVTLASGYISYTNVQIGGDVLAFGTNGSNTLYFKPTSVWNPDNPKYYVYCWKDAVTPVFYPTTSSIGTGDDKVYIIKAPFYSYTNCIFVRMSPNATGGSFNTLDGFWNQTEDITITSANNFFEITTMTGGTDGKSSGTWSRKS